MHYLFFVFLYSEFKEDRDLIEIPMPSYNFTQAELCCVIETAEELGLEHKVRGSVSINYRQGSNLALANLLNAGSFSKSK